MPIPASTLKSDNSLMKLAISKTLGSLIKERGLTLKALSKATDVSVSTLHEWGNGRTPKDPVQVQRVASYFGVSLHALLFGQEDPAEPLTKIISEDFFKGTFEITVKRVKLPPGKE
jgi:transcriptional regulator with XRE-family HTH domain